MGPRSATRTRSGTSAPLPVSPYNSLEGQDSRLENQTPAIPLPAHLVDTLPWTELAAINAAPLHHDSSVPPNHATPKTTYIPSAFRLLLLFLVPATAFEMLSLAHPSSPLFYSTLSKTTLLTGTISLNLHVLIWSRLGHRRLKQLAPFLACLGVSLGGVVVAWAFYGLGLGKWVEGVLFIGEIGGLVAGVEGIVALERGVEGNGDFDAEG